MLRVSSCSCLSPFHWSQVLSREWKGSWSSADRWCANYIWVIKNVIVYKNGSYIRGFTVACSIMCSSKYNYLRSIVVCLTMKSHIGAKLLLYLYLNFVCWDSRMPSLSCIYHTVLKMIENYILCLCYEYSIVLENKRMIFVCSEFHLIAHSPDVRRNLYSRQPMFRCRWHLWWMTECLAINIFRISYGEYKCNDLEQTAL